MYNSPMLMSPVIASHQNKHNDGIFSVRYFLLEIVYDDSSLSTCLPVVMNEGGSPEPSVSTNSALPCIAIVSNFTHTGARMEGSKVACCPPTHHGMNAEDNMKRNGLDWNFIGTAVCFCEKSPLLKIVFLVNIVRK